MKKKLLSLLLCLCMVVPMLIVPTSAAATNIKVSEVNYYENTGDVADLTVSFGWNTASATSRLTVMTKKLRSAGESGTSKSYGDFTDYGYYGKSFKNWKDVLAANDKFGMLYYADEQKITMNKTNTITLKFDEGDIPLNKDQTYYLYLWTYYGGHYYPDNLFMVLQVKNGKFQFAPATGRNSYGSFTALWEKTDGSGSTPAPAPAPTPAPTGATNIALPNANYYDGSGDVERLVATFGWNNPTATSRIAVMTKRLRSAGESGADKTYGDFTNLGTYRAAYKTWKNVLAASDKFGMLYYTDEQTVSSAKTNTFNMIFDEGDIPLDVDQTYYLYQWTYYGGQYYPDNLIMVLQVKNGTFQWAPATDRNSYGSFTALWEKTTEPAAPKFTDVKSDAYYATPVTWAVSKGITNGTTGTTFSPNNPCTRAQILTFLWRAAGSPQSIAFQTNPYTDIKETAYYYQAALWAKEAGLVQGTAFAPNTPCTRAATAEYFWKVAGSQTVNNVPFSDVSSGSELAKAVSWAVTYGITNGTSSTSFSPNNICTRGQIVTFLHRFFVQPLDNSAFIASVTKPAA